MEVYCLEFQLVYENIEEPIDDLAEKFSDDDSDDVEISTENGTSSSCLAIAIENLKEEIFVAKASESFGTCVVCLDELCGAKELIKMPCSMFFINHVFLLGWRKRILALYVDMKLIDDGD